MTALSGIFLWLTASMVVAAVLALRPHLWRLWDNVVEWVTCPPSEDVKSPCDAYGQYRAALGERSEVR